MHYERKLAELTEHSWKEKIKHESMVETTTKVISPESTASALRPEDAEDPLSGSGYTASSENEPPQPINNAPVEIEDKEAQKPVNRTQNDQTSQGMR